MHTKLTLDFNDIEEELGEGGVLVVVWVRAVFSLWGRGQHVFHEPQNFVSCQSQGQ